MKLTTKQIVDEEPESFHSTFSNQSLPSQPLFSSYFLNSKRTLCTKIWTITYNEVSKISSPRVLQQKKLEFSSSIWDSWCPIGGREIGKRDGRTLLPIKKAQSQLFFQCIFHLSNLPLVEVYTLDKNCVRSRKHG